MTKVNAKDLEQQLSHTFENVWGKLSAEELKNLHSVADGYKKFLDNGKTERECVTEIVKMSKENGYISLEDAMKKGKITAGDKIYAVNKEKSLALFVIGEENIENGVTVVGSHLDSPRIDIKPFPLYEDSNMVFLKTHYYGGIRKYQWTALPLALHGVLFNEKGEKIEISIGESEEDPIFFITDLLPHLAKDQNAKTLADGITGEGLNVLIGSIPSKEKEVKEKFKFNILTLLNEKYGIVEEDFTTAELQIVPAGKARDIGFDRSLIAAYGHDDRVCAYASLEAVFELKKVTKTAIAYFSDKEEVGSMGNTGAESAFLENTMAELINLQTDNYSDLLLKRAFANTQVLSADVGAAYDPNFGEAYDKRNSGYIGHGVQIVKYTGSRGKGGCNDANAEFVSVVKNLFSENNVIWQIGELGKVDQGGGGTIAYILANKGAEVIDCGVPVLAMHAPYEAISKADLYMAYKGYLAFMNR